MSETLTTRAYALLRAKLSSGELKPGERLVNRKLAEEIGMSFTPVREAINQLASEGLVEYRRGAGAFVRKLDRDDLAELYDLRENLEAFAAERAATCAEPAEFLELEEACASGRALVTAMDEAGGATLQPEAMDAWVRAEESFHNALMRAAHNRWLTKVVGELRLISRIFASHRGMTELVEAGGARKTVADHTQLVGFCRAKDAAGARRCMAEHVSHGRESVLAVLDREDARSTGL